MAKLTDVPRVLGAVGPIAFLRRVFHQVLDDDLLTWAAAMAYSWLFALFPLLIFLLSLLPLLPDQWRNSVVYRVQGLIDTQLPGTAGTTVMQTVGPLLGVEDAVKAKDTVTLESGEVLSGTISDVTDEYVVIYSAALGRERVDRDEVAENGIKYAEEVEQEKAKGISSRKVKTWRGLLSFGLLITLFAASGGMNMTMSALDRCYDIKKPRPFWKQRLMAIGLTLVVGSLVLTVLLLIPVSSLILAFISGAWFETSPLIAWSLDVVRYTLALGLLILVLGLIYHFGPSLKRRFHLLTPGSVFTIVGWLLTGFAMRTYVTSFGGAENYAITYGAVGGIIILLLLFYVDALILMIGAEINSEIDFAILGIPSKGEDHIPDAEKPDAERDEEDRELAEQLREAMEEPAEGEEPTRG